MEMIVIVLIMILSIMILLIRNYWFTRTLVGMFLLYIGFTGVAEGISVSYNLNFSPISSPYVLMAPYAAGNVLGQFFLMIMVIGGLGILIHEIGG